MNKWNDVAIILHVRKYSDNSAIITVFTQHYGIISGILKSAYSKKNRASVNIGNLVYVNYSSRLEHGLGVFVSIEIKRAYPAFFYSDIYKLNALNNVCVILFKLIPCGEICNNLFVAVEEFFAYMITCLTNQWILNYIKLFNEFLTFSGFRLDLTKCAVTKSKNNLAFISPKSGKTICYDVGLPYKDKLFAMPNMLLNMDNINIDYHDINDVKDTINLFDYFINKHIFHEQKIKISSLLFAI